MNHNESLALTLAAEKTQANSQDRTRPRFSSAHEQSREQGALMPAAFLASRTSSASHQEPTRFAEGGHVQAGRAAWVGERGPELFIPQTAGRIVSHEESKAMQSSVTQDWRGEPRQGRMRSDRMRERAEIPRPSPYTFATGGVMSARGPLATETQYYAQGGVMNPRGPLTMPTHSFAGGGIMAGNGPLPVRRYAWGGVTHGPQVAVFGEGDTPEAYVPVPSGKIPVQMEGNPRQNTITFNIATPDVDGFRRSERQLMNRAVQIMGGAR